jgi:hypothetical protein
VSELGGRHFSQQDGSGGFEASHRLAINGGYATVEWPKAGGGRQCCRVVDVFCPEWDAMQGPKLAAFVRDLFGHPGGAQRTFRVQSNPGLQLRVNLRRAGQQDFDQLHW